MADNNFGYDLDPAKMDDLALVILLQECGFLPARNALIMRYEGLKNGLIAWLARHKGLQREDVEDAQQEAIDWIIEAFDRYDTNQIGKPGSCSFKSFLHTKIVSRFYDFVKHFWSVERHYDRAMHEVAEIEAPAYRQHASLMPDAWRDDSTADPANLAELRETMTRLHEALKHLDERDHGLWARLAGGKKPRVIAAELRLSHSQVNRRTTKMIEQVRSRLGESVEPPEHVRSGPALRARADSEQPTYSPTSTDSSATGSSLENPVKDQEAAPRLSKLLLPYIVALAARSARRVQTLLLASADCAALQIEQAIGKAEAFACKGPDAVSMESDNLGRSAIDGARVALDAARQSLQDAAQGSVQLEIEGTTAILRAAQPVPPGAADVIAAKRDEALADFRKAARHARELAHEFSTDKVTAARQKLHEAETRAAQADHAATLTTLDAAHTAREVVRAACDALAVLDVKAADAVESDLARLTVLADEQTSASPLGAAIDFAESGPLGPLWPAGEPAWFRSPGELPPQILRRTALAMRLEHVVKALASLSQALHRVPQGRGPATS